MSSQEATVHFPPTPPPLTRPSLILFGTIEPSPTSNWTTSLTTFLSNLPINILNPRRDDWDASWTELPSCAAWKEQVDWEMAQPGAVDLIVFCFRAESLCPVSLLELGRWWALYGGKTVVCVEEGFWKRGNVEVVCGRFGVEVVRDLEALGGLVRGRMEGVCRAWEEGEGSG